jgi:chromosome segregation ATPase
MARKKTFDVKRLITGTASVALKSEFLPPRGQRAQRMLFISLLCGLCVLCGLVSGGCKQLSRIEDNQLELHRALAASAKHLATNLVRVEENQSKMSAAIEQLQTGVNRTANNLTALGAGQEKLQAAIEDVQAGTKKHAATLAAARDEQKTFQAALGEALQAGRDDWTTQITKIGAGQGALQAGIADVRSDVKKVSGSADGLRQDMAQLRSAVGGLQAGTENVAGIIDIVGQKQLKFEEKILIDIRAISAAVDAIQQRQAKLAEQVGGVQNNTDQMRESMIAVLKQLKSELSRISSEVGSAKPGEAGASVSEVKK